MRRSARLALLLAFATQSGCPEGRAVPEQLYFKRLLAPVGVDVRVVKDESRNPATGGAITIIGVVQPDLDREELDRLLRAFFRQASGRRGFRGNRTPERIDIRLYDHADKATAAGNDWLGRAVRSSSSAAPLYSNEQTPPLLKWARKALGPWPQYTASIQPSIVARPETMTIELTLPFVRQDGSGHYVDTLTFQQAMTAFTSATTGLFDAIPSLRELIFIGDHQNRDVMRIALFRHQYDRLDLRRAEEQLGALRGKLQHGMVSGALSDRAVQRRLAAARRRIYRKILAQLPAQQVDIRGLDRQGPRVRGRSATQ